MEGRRIAVIGSGPAGFYTAEEALKRGVAVDLIERLPTPFGLVRSGVAPDHQRIKSVATVFGKIAANPRMRFFGNVLVGRDVEIEELVEIYDGVVLACGAAADRTLDIPGIALPGSLSASEVVGWYNGHPDHRDVWFPGDSESAVIIGNGNVALDLARVLLRLSPDLAASDIADHAMVRIRESRLRTVHIVGRRGPLEASFSPVELREILKLGSCNTLIDSQDLEIDEESLTGADSSARQNHALLCDMANAPPDLSRPTIRFYFNLVPEHILGESSVTGVSFRTNGNGREETRHAEIRCGMVLRSIGFRSARIPGVPFDDINGVVPNKKGRVSGGRHVIQRLYVAGWMKRGARGIIGTNRACGVETAQSLLADLQAAPVCASQTELGDILTLKGIQFTNYSDWQAINELELEMGRQSGKIREKLTHHAQFLDAVRASRCNSDVRESEVLA